MPKDKRVTVERATDEQLEKQSQKCLEPDNFNVLAEVIPVGTLHHDTNEAAVLLLTRLYHEDSGKENPVGILIPGAMFEEGLIESLEEAYAIAKATQKERTN